MIHGEKSESMDEPVLIGLSVFFINIAPIATDVSAEGVHDFIVWHYFQHTRRCDQASEGEFRFGR